MSSVRVATVVTASIFRPLCATNLQSCADFDRVILGSYVTIPHVAACDLQLRGSYKHDALEVVPLHFSSASTAPPCIAYPASESDRSDGGPTCSGVPRLNAILLILNLCAVMV